MSTLGSLSGGYKGGSHQSEPKVEPKPFVVDYVKNVTTSIRNHYIENRISPDDLEFLREYIKCLNKGTKYQGAYELSTLVSRILESIKTLFANQKIDNSNLRTIMGNITSISQNETQFVPEPKNDETPSTLNISSTKYKGGSPRVQTDKFVPKPSPNNKSIDSQNLSNNIKKWLDEGKLTNEDIQILLNNLTKL